VYDTLLFLHVLSAFTLGAAVVLFSASTLGAQTSAGTFALASRLEDVGGTAVLVFGVWLALYVDGYDIFDGWIIAAILLWAGAAAAGSFFRQRVLAVDGDLVQAAQQAATLSWVRTALFVLLLADMVWKPGA
jgi:hypothetical protein